MKLLITGSRGQLGNELVSIIKSGRAEIGEIAKGYSIEEVTAIDIDELELELIDLDMTELFVDDENIINIYAKYEAFGAIQSYLDEHNMEIVSGEFVRIPTDTKDVTPDQREALNKLIEKLEEDDDVTNVYTTMSPEEE